MLEPKRPAFHDRPDLAEIFADGIGSISIGAGVCKLVLTVARPEQVAPPGLSTVLASRVVLTLPAAADLHQTLGKLLTVVQRQNHAVGSHNGVNGELHHGNGDASHPEKAPTEEGDADK